MKKAICLLFAIGSLTTVFSQSTEYTVTGIVIDKTNKAPMQAASVFAQNTTFGTATGADGKFILRLPNGGYDLVVTFTGYETESIRITTADAANNNIVIELKQKDKTLEAVAVVGSNEVKDGWQQYGNFFLENFIGKTTFSSNCTLKNPEVLKFYFSKRKNRLKVLASEPLLIENNSLGYRIKYVLDSFTYEYSTEINTYTGNPLFEEITPVGNNQQATWAANRLKAYKGSMLHFMRSVYSKQLKEEGFEIQFLVKEADKEQAVELKNYYGAINYKKDDSTQTVEIMPNQLNLGVLYTKEKPEQTYLTQADTNEPKAFQFSFLSFTPGNSLVIEQNGYFFEQNDIAINGYWTWEKVADMLPYDYKIQ